MEEFFQVLDIDAVLSLTERFEPLGMTHVALDDALGCALSRDIMAPEDLPGFNRATMDGFAVRAASTFGASEGSPAYLEIKGTVTMGQAPDFTIGPGEAAAIATGGMLPEGADSVVMVEHTEPLDRRTLEVHRSVAPGQHVVAKDEDAVQGRLLLERGCCLRAQEIGLLAAIGCTRVPVYRRPRVGIVSTGDEVVPCEQAPSPGQIRDINTHTLAALVRESGAEPVLYGIVGDRYEALYDLFQRALRENDMVLVSGGSSVGARDMTLDALASLDSCRILFHGVSIRPGKPTILAICGERAIWGLPGHAASAMVVFMVLVRPFLNHIGGRRPKPRPRVKAYLSRNLASVQGRVDFVRVRLTTRQGRQWAEPIFGQSGLIRTMVEADGVVAVDRDSEGLDQGTLVEVMQV